MPDASPFQVTDDLPQALRDQVAPPRRQRKKRTSKYQPVILRLLGEHGELSISDLLIGMYRANTKVMTRQAMYAHLAKLKNGGLVERVLAGQYQLTDKGKQLFKKARQPAAAKR